MRLTLFGGSLLEFEVGFGPADDEPETPPFGFTGRCEVVDAAPDIDPLLDDR